MYKLSEQEEKHIDVFVSEMRKHYSGIISRYIVDHMYSKQLGIGEDWPRFFRECSVMQLKAIADRCAECGGSIVLHSNIPNPYASYMLFNIFVGVEPDGYTHS